MWAWLSQITAKRASARAFDPHDMLALEPRYVFDAALVVDLMAPLPADTAHPTSSDGALPVAIPAPASTNTGLAAESLHLWQHPTLFQAIALASGRDAVSPEAVIEELPPRTGGPMIPVEHVRSLNETMLVILDSHVADWRVLQEGLPSYAEVVHLDETSGGLGQIAQALAARGQAYNSIHIVAGGESGRIELGSDWIDATALEQHRDALATLRDFLAPDGDLLVYGSSVGAGAAGQVFLDELARLTGADVAASIDATGHALLGGDWDLESRTGPVEAAIMGFADWFATLGADPGVFAPPTTALPGDHATAIPVSTGGHTDIYSPVANDAYYGFLGGFVASLRQLHTDAIN